MMILFGLEAQGSWLEAMGKKPWATWNNSLNTPGDMKVRRNREKQIPIRQTTRLEVIILQRLAGAR